MIATQICPRENCWVFEIAGILKSSPSDPMSEHGSNIYGSYRYFRGVSRLIYRSRLVLQTEILKVSIVRRDAEIYRSKKIEKFRESKSGISPQILR